MVYGVTTASSSHWPRGNEVSTREKSPDEKEGVGARAGTIIIMPLDFGP